MPHAAVRVRLDVTDVQASVLLRAAGARRFAWNWAVAKIKANADQWAAEASYGIERADRVRPLTYFTLSGIWTAEQPLVAPWAREQSTWTLRYAVRDAATAYAAFLAGKRGFPKFRARRHDRERFTVREGLALEPGRLRLAKYGWLRIAAACPQQAKLRRLLRRGHARLQHATVTRHADGHWYAAVTYERVARIPGELHRPPAGPVVGVDRGLKTAAVVATSAGDLTAVLPTHRRSRSSQRQLKHLQRAVARKEKGSANRRRAALRLARVHARRYQTVVVEDVGIAGLLRNRRLTAPLRDQAWFDLSRQLAYKTARHGGRLIVANRWFASSKTCSACGVVRPKLTLAERTYRRDACGLIRDRDVNAAANLAAWGEHALGLCPCVTQAGDRHPGGPSAEDARHACGGWGSDAAATAAAVPPREAGTSRPRSGVA